MVTKAYYTERPDSIKYMSLPSADTADLWMRKNITEVTDPETGAKSYEADEAYMRTTLQPKGCIRHAEASGKTLLPTYSFLWMTLLFLPPQSTMRKPQAKRLRSICLRS